MDKAWMVRLKELVSGQESTKVVYAPSEAEAMIRAVLKGEEDNSGRDAMFEPISCDEIV